jgi:hypothetical protein
VKIKNLHLYGLSAERKATLADEYRQIGFHVETTEDKLTVFALPKKVVKEKKTERKPRRERD